MRWWWGTALAVTACLTAGAGQGLGAQQTEPVPGDRTAWGFGTEVGYMNGTAEGSVFALRFNAELFFSRAFSLGPSLMVTPVQDYSELSVAGVTRFRIPVEINVSLVPFSGIGFVDADFEREDETTGEVTQHDDVSIYFPVGVGVEFDVGNDIFAVGTILVNLHSLDFDAPIGKDEASVAFLLGVQYQPRE